MAEEIVDAEIVEDEALEQLEEDRARRDSTPPRTVVVHVPVDFDRPVGDDGTMSPLDNHLLRLAADGLTLVEIADETGLEAAEVGMRVKDILASSDWLTLLEMEALMWRRISRLARDLERRIETFDDSRDYATLGRVLNTLLTQVNRRKDDAATSKTKIRSAHAAMMAMALEASFEQMSFLLADRGLLAEGVDVADLREVMEVAVKKGIESVNEQVTT